MPASSIYLEDLRTRIADKSAVVIVGAGVSVSSTNGADVASWRGLVENGLDRCVGFNELSSAHAESLKQYLSSDDDELLQLAANVVDTKLQKKSGEFALWLNETIGRLTAINDNLVNAIAALDCQICTTNYDNILEDVTGLSAVNWRMRAEVDRLLRKESSGILHVHGHYKDPDSVVLGTRSYELVASDPFIQTTLRTLRQSNTLIFVGFGKGLSDPNFGAFFRWSRNVFEQSPYRHYRLALESEVDELQASHDPNERVVVLPYGQAYSDLCPFLESLIPQTSNHVAVIPSAPPQIISRNSIVELFHAEVEEAASHTKRGEPDVAIALLERLRNRHRSDFTNRIWFRVLANLAQAYAEKDDFDRAAVLYLQAKDFEPSNVDARCYEALAYYFRKDIPRANALAGELKNEHPQSTLAHAVWVRTTSTSVSIAQMETDIPEHIRESPDVAHALMLAAHDRREFPKAETYGEHALRGNIDSPIILEQLGEVYLEHARFKVRELDADVLPISAQLLADKALKTLERAMLSLRRNVSSKAKAHLHFGIAIASQMLGKRPDYLRHIRLAYDNDAQNPEIVLAFALHLAAAKELSAAIALVEGIDSHLPPARAAGILSKLYLARRGESDYERARQKLEPIVFGFGTVSTSDAYEQAADLLLLYAKESDAESAQRLLDKLSACPVSSIMYLALKSHYFRATSQRELELKAVSEAFDSIKGETTRDVRRVVARELTYSNQLAQAVTLWSSLLTEPHLSQDVRLAVESAVHVDDAKFAIDFCRRLREAAMFDERCIRAELECLNSYNCVETMSVVMQQCIDGIENDAFRKELRAHRSMLGVELGKADWICTDPNLLPSANDATPIIGRIVTQLLVTTRPLEAVEYAYQLLRRHFGSKDANFAVIASVLLGGSNLVIPEHEQVRRDSAVAYQEDSSKCPTWWVIETSEKPDRGRRELAPEHPLAKLLDGKIVGDRIQLRDATLQERGAKIVAIQNKYVYRFQQCMQEFEAYFPGEHFLMQFNGVNSENEPDLEPMLKSVNQRIEWIRQLERHYRTAPSINAFADRSSRHVIQAMSHAASSSLPIRCCHGNGKELDAAFAHLRKATAIVLDASAVATLHLARGSHLLSKLQLPLFATYGTLRTLRRFVLEQQNTNERGFLTKAGEQLVLHERSKEELELYAAELRQLAQVFEQVVRVEEGLDFASISKKDRDNLEKAFGRPCAESVAVASRDGFVLWTDDLPLALCGAAATPVRHVWTQLVASFAEEKGWLTGDEVSELTLGLFRLGHSVTRLRPEHLIYAGEKSNWDVSDSDLLMLIRWFENNDIPAKSVGWLGTHLIRHVLSDSIDVSKGDQVLIQFFRCINSRNDGPSLIIRLGAELTGCAGLSQSQAERVRQLLASIPSY